MALSAKQESSGLILVKLFLKWGGAVFNYVQETLTNLNIKSDKNVNRDYRKSGNVWVFF